MTKLSDGQTSKLVDIVAATQSAEGCMYMTEKSVQLLVDADYAECNISMTDPNDPKKVAVRATATGVAYVEAPAPDKGNEPMSNNENAATEAAPATQFPIEDVALSGKRRRRSGAAMAKYPFDALQIGQSFFVPATDEMPNPGKSLASTVSSASKRYATENGTRSINRKNKETGEMEAVQVPAYIYERKFSVETVYGEGDQANTVIGARVGRVAVEEADAE